MTDTGCGVQSVEVPPLVEVCDDGVQTANVSWSVSSSVQEGCAREEEEFSRAPDERRHPALGEQVPCFTPLKAYRASGGGVVFSAREGHSDRPLEVRCGQCIGCRIDKSREWALRCVHEAQLHARNSFVTLTYRPEVTWHKGVRYGLPEDGSLDVRHWQLFAKRVRKEIGPFRYLHCGEYGDANFRPHYHACLFGLDFRDDRVLWRDQRGIRTYTSPSLEALWGHGFCTIGELTWQSAAYVARYTLKKVNGDRALEARRRINLETGEEYYVAPEYVTMSRRPGLGSEWFSRYADDVFPSDECIHEGKRYLVPEYYMRTLEQVDPELYARVKSARRGAVARGRDGGHSTPGGVLLGSLPQGDLHPDRLAVREKVTEAKVASLRRDV